MGINFKQILGKKIIVSLLVIFIAFSLSAQNALSGEIKIIGTFSTANKSAFYVLQAGSFKNKGNAQRSYNALKTAGLNPKFEAFGEWTRVIIPFVAPCDVEKNIEKIRQAGFKEVWIRIPKR